VVMGRCPSRMNNMGSSTRKASREFMSVVKALLRTSVYRGIKTLVTRPEFLTMADREEDVPVEKNCQAIMPTSMFMAKFCSRPQRCLKTKYRTSAIRRGLSSDQKKPRVVFW